MTSFASKQFVDILLGRKGVLHSNTIILDTKEPQINTLSLKLRHQKRYLLRAFPLTEGQRNSDNERNLFTCRKLLLPRASMPIDESHSVFSCGRFPHSCILSCLHLFSENFVMTMQSVVLLLRSFVRAWLAPTLSKGRERLCAHQDGLALVCSFWM